MKVWIINQYNMPPKYGHLNRHYNFAKYLARNNYEVKVFVGSFLHGINRQIIKDDNKILQYNSNTFEYFFIKTISYNNSKIKRIYAMFEYYFRLKKILKNNDWDTPDIILGSSAHPLNAYLAIKLSHKIKCKNIVEIRDLWPETFVSYKLIKRNGLIHKLLLLGERYLYYKADKLIFTMEGTIDYVKNYGWDKKRRLYVDINKVYNLNNGVDLEVFNNNLKKFKINDLDLLDTSKFKAIYVGSIKYINNIGYFVEAAKILNDFCNNVIFLVYGEGEERKKLERYCRENNITNIKFKGFVEKKYIPSILSYSDLNLLHYNNNSIKKYGMSFNKFFDYLASGKPILSDALFKYDLINKYKLGKVVDNATPKEYANSIFNFYKMDKKEYSIYCENSRKLANDYSFKNLTNKLIKIFNER